MKRYSPVVILAAKEYRSQGHTYREICKLLDEKVPKGTLSFWFKNIPMTTEYYQRIKGLGFQNIYKAQAHNKKVLAERLNQLRDKNVPLIQYINQPVGKLLLATLYWCEGNKYPGSRNLKFGNSDPGMINLFLTLLRNCYSIDENKFRLTIQCRADQNLSLLTDHWTKVTKIPLAQHYHPRIDRRSLGKPTQKIQYQGVCVIDYFDANLQCELQFLGEVLGSTQYVEQVKNQLI